MDKEAFIENNDGLYSSDETLISLQEKRKIREEKKAKQRIITLVVFVILVVALTLVMISVIRKDNKPRPQLYIMVDDQLEFELKSKALILRDEKTIASPATGILQPYKANGQRSGVNQKVAQILPKSAEKEYKILKDLNHNIAKRQLELLKSGRFDDVDLIKEIYARFDTEFPHFAESLIKISIDEAPLNNISVIDSELNVLLAHRSKEFLKYDFQDDDLNQLLKRKNNLEKNLNQNKTDILSKFSGIVSYLLDDYNKPLKIDELKNISSEEISPKEVSAEKLTIDQDINQGQNAINIINGYEQYLLMSFPSKEINDFHINNLYDIYVEKENINITNTRLIDIKVDEKNPELSILTFKADNKLENLAHLRRIDTVIKLKSQKGLKVPISALMKEENQNNKSASIDIYENSKELSTTSPVTEEFSIMIVEQGYVYLKSVEILARDKQYAIITGTIGSNNELKAGSVIVQNPDVITPGSKLE